MERVLWRLPRLLRLLRLLLLLRLFPTAGVVTAAGGARCDPDKYEWGDLCCDLCPAGHHVNRPCSVDQPTDCHPCEPDTFRAHRNREQRCLPCTRCREDQELVTDCAPYSDRRCQCKTGSYFCDAEGCPESCFRCARCPGATLQACNATSDAVCAPETTAELGNPPGVPAHGGWFHSLVAASVVLSALAIIVCIVVYLSRSPGGAEVELSRGAADVRCRKLLAVLCRAECAPSPQRGPSGRPSEPGSHSHGSVQPNGVLPRDPENGRPAPGVETTLLLAEGDSAVAPTAGTPTGPPGDPEGGMEMQVVVSESSRAAPEQALQTPAAAAPQGRAETDTALRHLEQVFKRQYVVKDTSCHATNLFYYSLERQVPESQWKMFVQFLGLEESDTELCEY